MADLKDLDLRLAPSKKLGFVGLDDNWSYARGLVSGVAKVLEHGDVGNLQAAKAGSTKRLDQLKADRDMITALADTVAEPGMFVADSGDFRSKPLVRAMRADLVYWVQSESLSQIADQITLAQKFKIADEIADIGALKEFADDLHKQNLLRMPYDQMYVEYKVRHGDVVLPVSLYVDNWRVHEFCKFQGRWVGLGGKDGDPTFHDIFCAFLVLLASKSITVEPSDGHGNPMQAVEASEPRYSHHLVKIRAVECERSGCGGTHASPRLHWRRGHIRNVRCGPGRSQRRKVWVAPMLVGSADRGVVTHDYVLGG